MGGLVAGALVLVGCSSSGPIADSASQATTGSSDGPETSGPSTTTGATTASSTSVAGAETGSWERVDMGFVSAYVLVRAGEAVIVDTGPAGNEAAIAQTLAALGVDWSNVADVVLTHRHPDHVGSLGAIVDLASQATLSTGAADVDAIGRDLGLRGLVDGDVVNGLDVIATPGHTPGHIAILDRVAGVLLAGDALNGADGGVAGPNPQFTPDMATANASVRVLAGYDYETILFGHGEPVTADGSTLVATLADTIG